MDKGELLQEILRILSPAPKSSLSQLNMSDNEVAIETLFPDTVDQEATLMNQSTSASEQITAGSKSARNNQTAEDPHIESDRRSVLRRGVEKRMQAVINQNDSQPANSAHPDNVARDCLYKNTRPPYLKAKRRRRVSTGVRSGISLTGGTPSRSHQEMGLSREQHNDQADDRELDETIGRECRSQRVKKPAVRFSPDAEQSQ